jgi:hypothetical protein
MNIYPDKLFWLYITAGQRDDAIELLEQGLIIGPVFEDSQFKYRILWNFYPEILRFPKAFCLDNSVLKYIFKTELNATNLLEQVKLFAVNNLLTTNACDTTKMCVEDVFISLNAYAIKSWINKQNIHNCFSYLESIDLNPNYEKILLGSFTNLFSNYHVINYCLEKGVTLTIFDDDMCDSLLEKLSDMDLESYENSLMLGYLLDNYENLKIDLKKLFYAVGCSYGANSNIDILKMFLDKGLILDTDDDMVRACYWIGEDNVCEVVKILTNLPAYALDEALHKKYILNQIEDLEYTLDVKVKIFELFGIDLMVQLKEYCLNPMFEADFDIDYLCTTDEFEKFLIKPFLFNTEKEFLLYVSTGSAKFADAMIKNGFELESSFVGNKTSHHILEFLCELCEDFDHDPTFFKVDLSEYLKKKNSKTFDQEFDQTDFSIIEGYQVVNMIHKYNDIFNADLKKFVELITKIGNKINVLATVFISELGSDCYHEKEPSKERVDVCLNLMKNIHGEELTKTTVINSAIESIRSMISRRVRNPDALTRSNDFSIKKVLMECISDFDIDFINDVVLSVVNLSRTDSYTLIAIDFFMFLGDYELEDFFLDENMANYLLDTLAYVHCGYSKPFDKIRTDMIFFACLNADYFRPDTNEKLLEVFVSKPCFKSKDIAFNFYSQVEICINDMDALLLETLLNSNLETLSKKWWFANKHFAEYILGKSGYAQVN